MKAISSESKSQRRRPHCRARRLLSVGCAAGLAVAASLGLIRIQAQQSFPLPAINPPGAKAAAPTTGTAPAAQSASQQAGATANGSGTPEVARQCAELLKLATDLKTAVDQSSASTLSVTVVRKAGEIEQLAHKVRLTSGKS
ncbi:MAG: hypothetical protein WCF30_15150 [Terracidiphilus sp.]